MTHLTPPETAVPVLKGEPLTEAQYRAVLEIVAATSQAQDRNLINDKLTIRYRIELCAAFLSELIAHARIAAHDDAKQADRVEWLFGISADALVDDFIKLAIERAREIERQGHA